MKKPIEIREILSFTNDVLDKYPSINRKQLAEFVKEHGCDRELLVKRVKDGWFLDSNIEWVDTKGGEDSMSDFATTLRDAILALDDKKVAAIVGRFLYVAASQTESYSLLYDLNCKEDAKNLEESIPSEKLEKVITDAIELGSTLLFCNFNGDQMTSFGIATNDKIREIISNHATVLAATLIDEPTAYDEISVDGEKFSLFDCVAKDILLNILRLQ